VIKTRLHDIYVYSYLKILKEKVMGNRDKRKEGKGKPKKEKAPVTF
jgi:hypothetical protein|tara:strand:+ start:359 stop:496 length:138 start_codon:yes stop_codon:yes gene_type:complete